LPANESVIAREKLPWHRLRFSILIVGSADPGRNAFPCPERKGYLGRDYRGFIGFSYCWTVGASNSILHPNGMSATRARFISKNLPTQQDTASEALLHPPANSDPDSAVT
jgi:hypothetical protein